MIETKELTRRFGSELAVDKLDLSAPAGCVYGFLGPNGAGKTTLFNAIAGSLLPTHGRIWFNGVDITRVPPNRRAVAGISRTFQITNLFAKLTVRENILLSVRGRTARKFSVLASGDASAEEGMIVDKALAESNLTARAQIRVDELSYGEQRQLELAIALASAPAMLLLDEPAAGLSPAERVTIGSVIRALPHDLTIILIEHDMDLALSLVDHVTCLHFGQVL
mgnify:CR=1 FL=1